MIKLVLFNYSWKNSIIFIEYLLSTSYELATTVDEYIAVNKWTKIPGFMALTCYGAL